MGEKLGVLIAVIFSLLLIFSFFLLHKHERITVEGLVELISLWESNAPFCEKFPSTENCADVDMTFFSALMKSMLLFMLKLFSNNPCKQRVLS